MPIEIDGITYERGVTHPATFHADDVFATALLRTIDPDFPIERRDATDDDGATTLVYDESRPCEQRCGRFDHHGPTPPKRKNGITYSSFGLLWAKLGTKLCHSRDARLVDEQLVQPIDINDNTGKTNLLSMAIADIQQAGDDVDESFWDAVEFAQGILARRVKNLNKTRQETQKAMALAEKAGWPDILVMDEYLDGWSRVGMRNECMLFGVFPSLRGGWAAQGVRVRPTSGKTRCPFPKEWCEASDKELVAVTGVSDVTFCHKSGFIACAKTKAGAVALAKKAAKLHGTKTRWIVRKTAILENGTELPAKTVKVTPDERSARRAMEELERTFAEECGRDEREGLCQDDEPAYMVAKLLSEEGGKTTEKEAVFVQTRPPRRGLAQNILDLMLKAVDRGPRLEMGEYLDEVVETSEDATVLVLREMEECWDTDLTRFDAGKVTMVRDHALVPGYTLTIQWSDGQQWTETFFAEDPRSEWRETAEECARQIKERADTETARAGR